MLQAIMLRSSITLYILTGMIPTRGYGINRMVAMANGISGGTAKNKFDALFALNECILANGGSAPSQQYFEAQNKDPRFTNQFV